MKLGLFRATFRHVWKTGAYRIAFWALLVLLALLALNYRLGGKLLTAEDSLWKSVLDPSVGVFTLMTALAIWWGEASQDFLHSLPKRLTVEFHHAGRRVMVCEDAGLSDEADIRNLGQQIGRQMNDNQDIPFKAPAIRYQGGELKQGGEGEYHRAYTVVFELTRLPKIAESLDLDAGEHWSWKPPFDAEPQKVR